MKGDPYRQAVRLFGLLAHPARLRILDELRRGEACVCHLQAVLKRPQPYISQQLRVLRQAGVIEARKQGLYVYYRLADERVERLLGEILGPVGTPSPLPACSCPQCQEELTLPDDHLHRATGCGLQIPNLEAVRL
ncbi:MAG TPA: transcriptional regulator [Chloroflexi bacterium]|nr:transcriptional regulator [Chloroflexota bacterium]